MDLKDIDFVKRTKIGWKVGTVCGRSLGLVKLEINPDDIISDPDIRLECVKSGSHLGMNAAEVHSIYNANRDYESILTCCKEWFGEYVKERSHDWVREREMCYISMYKLSEIDTALHYMKCRCARAKVLDMYVVDKPYTHPSSVTSFYDSDFAYRKGDIVVPKGLELPYDLNLTTGESNTHLDICGPGIHYFEDWKSAVLYGAVQREWSITIECVYKLLFGAGEVIFDGQNS